jgi:hypothetical protein
VHLILKPKKIKILFPITPLENCLEYQPYGYFGAFLCLKIVRGPSGEVAKNGEFLAIQFSVAFYQTSYNNSQNIFLQNVFNICSLNVKNIKLIRF